VPSSKTKYQQKKGRKPRPQPAYNIIVNPKASDFSRDRVTTLIDQIKQTGARYYIFEHRSTEETASLVKRVVSKRPAGIVACGGDGTVNLVARNMIRRTTPLGIFPLGRFNNIYRSLLGTPDIKNAIGHILSGKDRKIDYGLASGQFFLGTVAIGLIPELYDALTRKKKSPRFAISWSRIAAQAAANASIDALSVKVDAFGFKLTPQTVTISLLSHCLGLPFVPASLTDDGRCEIVFDVGQRKAIMSEYIRQIFKGKHIYSDEIRLFRGEKISLTPMEGRKIYIDGEITRCRTRELAIETVPKRIRILSQREA
jgi:diacylglycerol kinase family enzyme